MTGVQTCALPIYLINEGKVEEEGTHEELMARQGHYARIYRAQADLYAME